MYYCYGISFIDAAMLTRSNLENCNCGTYIVYKRNKTKDNKDSRPIRIRISTEINLLLDWFSSHTHLYGDYLLPIVSVPGYSGERLYSHIRGTLQAFQQKSQQPRARYRTQGIQAHELRGTTHHGHDPAGASCATRDHITDSRTQGPLHHFSLPRQFCRQHHRRGCPGPVRSRPCHFRPCYFYYVQHIPQTYYTDSHTYTSQQLAGLPVFSHKTSILPQVQQTPIFKSSDY